MTLREIFVPRQAPNARGLRAGAAEPASTETGVAGSVNTAVVGPVLGAK